MIKKNPVINRIACAHEKTRTSKSLSSLHPECSVFTNFTTWALSFWYCAQDKSRTCTTHSSPPPQSGVSTNFTTWALKRCKDTHFFIPRNTLHRFFLFFLEIFRNYLILNKFSCNIFFITYNIDKIHSFVNI